MAGRRELAEAGSKVTIFAVSRVGVNQKEAGALIEGLGKVAERAGAVWKEEIPGSQLRQCFGLIDAQISGFRWFGAGPLTF